MTLRKPSRYAILICFAVGGTSSLFMLADQFYLRFGAYVIALIVGMSLGVNACALTGHQDKIDE